MFYTQDTQNVRSLKRYSLEKMQPALTVLHVFYVLKFNGL
jgi:hypothetical protein